MLTTTRRTNQSQAAGKDHDNDESFKVSMFNESIDVTTTLPKDAPNDGRTDDVTARTSLGATIRTTFVRIFNKNDMNLNKLKGECPLLAELKHNKSSINNIANSGD